MLLCSLVPSNAPAGDVSSHALVAVVPVLLFRGNTDCFPLSFSLDAEFMLVQLVGSAVLWVKCVPV